MICLVIPKPSHFQAPPPLPWALVPFLLLPSNPSLQPWKSYLPQNRSLVPEGGDCGHKHCLRPYRVSYSGKHEKLVHSWFWCNLVVVWPLSNHFISGLWFLSECDMGRVETSIICSVSGGVLEAVMPSQKSQLLNL